MRRFTHRDVDRTLVFGRGALADAVEAVGGPGFALLTTARAAAAAPALVAAAAEVVTVPRGRVDVVAADLLAAGVQARLRDRVVALGGGRVIDVAKALCAARAAGGRAASLAAVPTTLSGAEMTGGHRHARGVDPATPRARVTTVVNDPALSASAPPAQLAASSANALGHALVAVASVRATPLSAAVARTAAAELATAWRDDEDDAVDRDAAALGALLAGWALDAAGLGPHHVLAQTATRAGVADHAQSNASLLPVTAAAARRRAPAALAELDAAIGAPLETLATELRTRAGGSHLTALATDDALLDALVATALARERELALVPPAPDARELRALYRAAAH